MASSGDSAVPQKLFHSKPTAAHFFPFQGKREDKAAHCSAEAEGGGEGGRDRAKEGPHRSDCGSVAPFQGSQAGDGGKMRGSLRHSQTPASSRPLPHAGVASLLLEAKQKLSDHG